MCKEDVRFMRRTKVTQVTGPVFSAPAKFLQADPNRLSLMLFCNDQQQENGTIGGSFNPGTGAVAETTTTNTSQLVQAGYMEGTAFIPVLATSPASPSDRITVMEYGQAVTQEIWVRNVPNLGVNPTVVAVSLITPLEDS